MKTTEIWCEVIPKPTDPNVKLTNQVWCSAYNNDGSAVVAVVGDAILIYDSQSGELLNKPLRGQHKDTINYVAFSADGTRFATCGSDNQVIIWQYNTNAKPDEVRVTAELRYQHSDAVYCLAFNPLTGQIFSGGAADYIMWTPDSTNVEKQKVKDKITCCAWSYDGLILAYGTMNGSIFLKNRKLEDIAEIKRGSVVWCMDWIPIIPEAQENVLAVGVWDQTVTLYNANGQQLGSDRKLTFDPLSINFYSNGELYIISGTNNKASLYAKDGGFLADVSTQNEWIWSARLKPKSMYASITTNDGKISQVQITPLNVHGLYQDTYAYRDNLTDIVVQNMSINQKVRIKCKELVKHISLYKDKLAAHLNDKIFIYQCNQEEQQRKYKQFKRITKTIDCVGFEILSNHIVVAMKNKLQLLKFTGELEREWILDARVNCIKLVGGAKNKENILVGLNNGCIMKVFIDNSFPILLCQHNVPIVVCDLSLDKKKLAIVDTNQNLTVIDTVTKEQLQQEMNINSCAFNNDYNDMIAYSGGDAIFMKTSNHPALSQKMVGQVVGFKGSKMFVLNDLQENNLQTIDISQTTTMLKFMEKKEYDQAYQVACLGTTLSDFKMLGCEALINQNFVIAKKCFQRTDDQGMLELVKKYEVHKKENTLVEAQLQGDVLAYQGKFDEAAQVYTKGGFSDQANQMYVDLRDFVKARTKRPGSGEPQTHQKVYAEEPAWKEKIGEWQEAAKLYIQCGCYKKAIDIYMNKNFADGLIEVCRQLDKKDNEQAIQLCAQFFKQNKLHAYLKEAYIKLGDTKGLLQAHIDLEKWDEALLLGKQNIEYLEMVKLPYAQWLCKQDRYEEALKAFKQLGRHDLTSKLLNTLSKNSVEENRFEQSAQHFWTLATECLKLVKNGRTPVGRDIDNLEKFKEFNTTAEIYYAYNKIYNFIEEPFNPMNGLTFLVQIFNAAKFCLSKLGTKNLYGVKPSFIYYALGKTAKELEGYKTARICYQKLSLYKIPNEWTQMIELSDLLIKSKPFADKDSLQPLCARCMISNPVIGATPDCSSCKHQFINSMISFENLPLVEFVLDSKLNHKQFIELLHSDKSNLPKYNKKKGVDERWSESQMDNQQVLSLQNAGNENQNTSPFLAKLNEILEMQQTSQEYIPVQVDEHIIRTMDPDEIYWVDYTKYCPTYQIKYYKAMANEIAFKVCPDCGKFFLLDEFEFEYTKSKKCPFCKTLDKREGPQKDIFDV